MLSDVSSAIERSVVRRRWTRVAAFAVDRDIDVFL